MYTFLIVVHVLAAFSLILAIIVFQTSKGSALAMFGGGGDSLFNSATGTSFIKKFTITMAGIFAATSLLLTVFASSNRMRSVVQEYPLQTQAPSAPAAQPSSPAPAAPVKK
ncbi:MAG: preprotein translocase subunit SecG [Elusimicrobia bacterium GWC2_51_8]|nr:MAG: preprotein translocase subunit SecG [Elusimicrobia bacterium GWA2_51_34]OGR60767.1 MAG: preprotein translocase subunit SecG [Elusimicrobia bacterium GWC2_51_8]OGR88330.1 MAG: preprotein translocase subunit SecG [Elusimicrobia bacterium GWF2_52_66]HAF96587.1 preprotein translocase subunit SecG [Elusimicrobiota bacterium]HCE98187.1 preprotein translocase subunit SecG [Elusimicrobiota bacterium]